MQSCSGSQSPTSCHRAGGHCVSYNKNSVGSVVWLTVELNILTVTLQENVFVLVQICHEFLDLSKKYLFKGQDGGCGHTALCNIRFHLICRVFMVYNKRLK